MNEQHEPSNVSLPLPLKRRVDQVCMQFQAAWNAGERPRIEDYLADTPEPVRSTLLRELLALDLEFRSRSGEQPTLEEYRERFPDHIGPISDAFNQGARYRPPEPQPVTPIAGAAAESTRTWDTNLDREASTVSELAPSDLSRVTTSPGSGNVCFGDYELLKEIARGGMGVVYKARQISLKRIVAVKMILAGQLASDEDIRRFRTEAEAAAQLQHPNIVAIHEVGQVDGQHFFSMDYVEGTSLKAMLREDPLPPDRAARYVATIAEAIHYAHAKGILHRDLKPSNVLMARSDRIHAVASEKDTDESVNYEPKVTDFGLAKRIEGDSELTGTGQVLGTPSYMPPEQASGDVSRISPVSDVYSLGATLYELLTGRPPFRAATVIDTIRQVLDAEPVSPRLLNPKVPLDLETITLKCLSKEASRRYATADELAADLRRWLAGEPIHARPIPTPARAWRYCKRRPLVSSFAALFILSMLVGISISSYFAVLANNRADLAEKRRLELHSTNTQLTDANETAETRRIAAEQAAVVAREQSQLALHSLEDVIFDIQRGLMNVPGAGEVRRKLLATALERLEEVSDQLALRSAIDRNTAVALGELGDVFLRIGSGGSDIEPTGPVTAARRLYLRALEIVEKLSAADPADAQVQRDLSVSYNRLGYVNHQAGEAQRALDYFQKGLAIRQKLSAADPTDAHAQHDLADSHRGMGDAYSRLGLLEKAREHFTLDMELAKTLADEDPQDAHHERHLSISYERLGDVSLQAGEVQCALENYQKGLEISQRLSAADPTDTQAEHDLADTHQRMGEVYLRLGSLEKAREHFTLDQELAQDLTEKDAKDAHHQRHLSLSYEKLGDVSRQTGEVQRALEYYQKGLDIKQKRSRADPTDAQAQRDLSISYDRLGNVIRQAGEVQRALEYYQKGLEINGRRSAEDPTDAQAQRDLSISYDKLGDVNLQAGEVQRALEYYQKDLEISQKLAAVGPTNSHAQRDLLVSYSKLGDVSLHSGEVQRALEYYRKVLEINQKLSAADPTDAQAQFDLYLAYHKLAFTHQQGEQYQDAAQWYEKALEVLERLEKSGRLPPSQHKWIGIVKQAIEECEFVPLATGTWEQLLSAPTERLPQLLQVRITEQSRRGKLAHVVQAAAKLRELEPQTKDNLYNAACGYGLCAKLVAGWDGHSAFPPADGNLLELSSEEQGARQKHFDDALDCLRAAIAAGWDDFNHMQQDPDLALVRDRPEFQALLKPQP